MVTSGNRVEKSNRGRNSGRPNTNACWKKINKQRIKSWKLDPLLYLWLWLGIANDKSFLWQDCVTCLTHSIDISKVKWVSKRSTPAYVFISDPDGDMAVAVCDAEISSEISPEYLKEHLDMLNHATAGVSQILCKHRRAVKNRAKNIYWGGGLSATPWIQYRQRIACMSRAAAGKPLFTLPLICMQLSVNQAFCPQNKRPSERGSCSSPVACPSIFL